MRRNRSTKGLVVSRLTVDTHGPVELAAVKLTTKPTTAKNNSMHLARAVKVAHALTVEPQITRSEIAQNPGTIKGKERAMVAKAVKDRATTAASKAILSEIAPRRERAKAITVIAKDMAKEVERRATIISTASTTDMGHTGTTITTNTPTTQHTIKDGARLHQHSAVSKLSNQRHRPSRQGLVLSLPRAKVEQQW